MHITINVTCDNCYVSESVLLVEVTTENDIYVVDDSFSHQSTNFKVSTSPDAIYIKCNCGKRVGLI